MPWKPAGRKIGHVLLAAEGGCKIIHNLPLNLLHSARRNELRSIKIIDVGNSSKDNCSYMVAGSYLS